MAETTTPQYVGPKHIPNEMGDCPHYCRACLAEQKARAETGEIVVACRPGEEAAGRAIAAALNTPAGRALLDAHAEFDRVDALRRFILRKTPNNGERVSAIGWLDSLVGRLAAAERALAERDDSACSERVYAILAPLVPAEQRNGNSVLLAEAVTRALADATARADRAEKEVEQMDDAFSSCALDLHAAQEALVDVHDAHLAGGQPSAESFRQVGLAKSALAEHARMMDRGVAAAMAVFEQKRAARAAGTPAGEGRDDAA